jgi:MFS family permease
MLRSHLGRGINGVLLITSKRWLFLVAFPAGHGAVDWGSAALWILAPAMVLSMGISPWQLGLLFAAQRVAAAITHTPAGHLGDTVATRGRFLLLTFWWVAFAQLSASVLDGYWLVLVFLAIASAGSAAWHPVATGTMVQQMPNRRAFALGVHYIGGTAAEIVAPLLVGFLLVSMDWRQALQINTIPAIVMGLVFFRLARMVPPPHKSLEKSSLLELVRAMTRPTALLIIIMLPLHDMAVIAFSSMMPLYLQETRGFSSSLTGIAFSTFVISGALLAPLIGRLSDRYVRRPIAAIGLLGGGVTAFLIAIGTGTPTLFVLLALTGFFLLAVRPVIVAMALETIGKRESTVLGLIATIGEIGGAIGAIAAGLVATSNVVNAILLSASISMFAGVILCFSSMSGKIRKLHLP